MDFRLCRNDGSGHRTITQSGLCDGANHFELEQTDVVKRLRDRALFFTEEDHARRLLAIAQRGFVDRQWPQRRA